MTNTGWTWTYVMHHCDLPTYRALVDWWQHVQPVPQQLGRIAAYLGLPAPEPPSATVSDSTEHPPTSPPEQVMQEAGLAGLPAFQGRPADPALDLIPPAP